MRYVTYWYKRMSHPVRGLANGLRHDSAIQMEIGVGAIVLIGLHYWFGPFSTEGQLLLFLCWFLMIITEFQNSAIETALDRIHPERHSEIGHSKDLAAAAVFCAGVFGLISLYFVLSGKI